MTASHFKHSGEFTPRGSLLQLCPTLYNSMDCSPPGSFVHGILQATILEWVAMPSSSRGSPQVRDRTQVFQLQADSLSDELPGMPLSLSLSLSTCNYLYWLPQWLSSKESACKAGDSGDKISIPGSGRSPEGGNVHFSILARKIPWTEEPGGVKSMGSQRVGYD